jgi:hypothetical protein
MLWAGMTVCVAIESGKTIGSFDRLLAEDYNAEDTSPCEPQQALNKGPRSSTKYNLPSRDGLRFASSQALSAVVRDSAVNNGTAVDAFPCIEHEKEIREPFQHHHTLALRTFH